MWKGKVPPAVGRGPSAWRARPRTTRTPTLADACGPLSGALMCHVFQCDCLCADAFNNLWLETLESPQPRKCCRECKDQPRLLCPLLLPPAETIYVCFPFGFHYYYYLFFGIKSSPSNILSLPELGHMSEKHRQRAFLRCAGEKCLIMMLNVSN